MAVSRGWCAGREVGLMEVVVWVYPFHRPLSQYRRLLFLIFMTYLIKLIAMVIFSYQRPSEVPQNIRLNVTNLNMQNRFFWGRPNITCFPRTCISFFFIA